MRLAAAAAAIIAVLGAAPAHADSGPGPGMCQYLGSSYNTWYPCDQYQPWLPYGTAGNPPLGSQKPPWQCTGVNAHDSGCS